MFHRGPDAQKEFRHDNVHLYHFRLSILDLVGGVQPMQIDDLIIIFNGEIYNHKEVRKKFFLTCNTNSDTETILRLYKKLGKKCLHEFDGMFAFAIYDKSKKEIFLARDRAGKKPLYIYQKDNHIVFSSELNGLKSTLDLEINESNIQNYITYGIWIGDQTPFKNVIELKSGACCTIQTNAPVLKIEKWWDVHDFYLSPTKDNFQEAKTNVLDHLKKAVIRRVESSDLEVGTFLSGGIDSGLVTALAREVSPQLRTFTISFKGEYNEADLAKVVANKFETNHTEIPIQFDTLKNDFEKILQNYGEPFPDSSSIPSYYVAKAAKEHLTVILNGDGADELFGGYRRYIPFTKKDFLNNSSFLRSTAKITSGLMPISHNKKSKYNYIYRLVKMTSQTPANAYLLSSTNTFTELEGYFNFTPNYQHLNHSIERLQNKGLSGLKKIMNLDFDFLLYTTLLVKMDIACMANSLEGRSPFLSKELLEYAPTLDDNFKIKGLQTKYLLRDIARDILPSVIATQPKRGFEIPIKHWVNDELKEIIHDLLNHNSYSNAFFKNDFIEKLVSKKIKISEEKRAKIIFKLLGLEIWKNNL